jgi:AhpD family alkylhydroperoxidase
MSSVTRVSVGKQTPAAYKAMTALTTEVEANATEVGLDPLLVELVKIRTSQINGCAFCLDMHMRVALDGGETVERLAVLPAWRETQFFSEQERAALALAQVSAVTWLAIVMNAWNRVAITSRHPVGPRRSSQPPT